MKVRRLIMDDSTEQAALALTSKLDKIKQLAIRFRTGASDKIAFLCEKAKVLLKKHRKALTFIAMTLVSAIIHQIVSHVSRAIQNAIHNSAGPSGGRNRQIAREYQRAIREVEREHLRARRSVEVHRQRLGEAEREYFNNRLSEIQQRNQRRQSPTGNGRGGGSERPRGAMDPVDRILYETGFADSRKHFRLNRKHGYWE